MGSPTSGRQLQLSLKWCSFQWCLQMAMANGQEGESRKSENRYVDMVIQASHRPQNQPLQWRFSHGVKMDGPPKTAHFRAFLSGFCCMMLTDPFQIGGQTPRMSKHGYELGKARWRSRIREGETSTPKRLIYPPLPPDHATGVPLNLEAALGY